MLYNYLTVYGSMYETRHQLKNSHDFLSWTEENFEYVKYNPRKDINRYGLSITSLDGGLSGRIDLDSLYEYNKEHNTNYNERDFATSTPVYEYEDLKNCIAPIKKDIFRSHVLKINPGGYFPAHRDFYGMDIDSFRIIIPLANMNPPSFTFIIEDKIQQWNMGSLYFVDTAKVHNRFNASFDPTYMVVFNVDLNETTIKFITQNMKQT